MKFKIFKKKNIFTQNEIESLRNYFEEQNFFNKSIEIGKLTEMALLSKFMFSERLISYFEDFFKDKIYFMNKFVIQKNNRTPKKVKYHKDSGKIHQSRILSNSSNIYGKIGIPLQNNIK